MATVVEKDWLSLISEKELPSYDGSSSLLSEKIENYLNRRQQQERRLVFSLDNSDFCGVLLEPLLQNPSTYCRRMQTMKESLHCSEVILYLPDHGEARGNQYEEMMAMAHDHGIEIATGIVDVRGVKDALWLNINTLYDVHEVLMEDYTPGLRLSINGEPLKKYDASKTVEEIVGEDQWKAVVAGHHLISKEKGQAILGGLMIADGHIQVLTDKDCLLDWMKTYIYERAKGSCGKCVFCREGLIQMEYVFKEITLNRGKVDMLELVREIGRVMESASLCSVGQKAAYAPLELLEDFSDEVYGHIKEKRCEAQVCKSFIHIYIDPQLCTGCGDCVDVCPVDCIEGKARFIHMIDDLDCTKCGACIAECDDEAIQYAEGRIPRLPNKLTKVGRFKR